jgi:GNAT superfamily N-acetyltransferase
MARNALELCRKVERKQFEAKVALAAESERIGGGAMAFEESGSYMNRAVGLGLDGPVSLDEIDRFIAWFHARGDRARIEVAAFADPSLFQGLAARGFVLKEMMNVLALDLGSVSDVRARLPAAAASGCTLERVSNDDRAALHEYVAVQAVGFLPEGAPVPASDYRLAERGAARRKFDAFVARTAEGVVVAAGGCDSDEGVATLFGATVLPSHRRRGLQLALIAARAERARDRGCITAVIMSRPGIPTERNAERLGFQLSYARVSLEERA